MALFAALVVFLAMSIGTLVVCLRLMNRPESLSHRFREVVSPAGGPAPSASGRIMEWAASLWTRPGASESRAEKIAARVAAGAPSGAWLLLNQAGFRHPAAAPIYRGIRIALPVLLAITAGFLGRSSGVTARAVAVLTAAGVAAGLLLPNVFLRMKIRRRQEATTDALPDALDLLTVCVEAGLGLNAAFIKITEEFRLASPPLSAEFDVVNREMVAGKPRPEALRALADRTGIEDIKSLVAMLVQTEKLGTSLAQSLRVHSDSLRTRRRQRAEEAAAKTTIKLVFPLVFLLFPALFIVILGPGVIQILRVLFPIAGSTGG